VAPNGVVGVLTDAGVTVIGPSGTRTLPMPGATAFAFGPNGASVGIGTAAGTFTAIEVATGAAWGSVQLPAGITGVGWTALGAWIVGADRMLYRVNGEGAKVEAAITGADTPIASVACSGNGLIVAARTTDRVELYELHANKPIGEFLLRRSIGAIAFGPALTLAIGLDDADGNVVELGTGASFRTEPHPGRGRNTWRLENKVDLGAVRGAIALHQAGGKPIARYVPPQEDSGNSGCLGGCLGVIGLVLVLTVFCAGLLLVTYLLRSWGVWVPFQ
ncbi:MAG: hypothetical protein ABMB14_13425, partial [Myxococcota bacterium]